MIVTNRIYKVLLVACMVSSIPQILASENNSDENYSNQEALLVQHEDALFGASLKTHVDQMQEIIMILADLQAVVANNGVTVTNKRATIQSLQVLTMCMESLKGKMHVYTKIEEIPELTCIISAVIEHIKSSVHNGFVSSEAFDFEASIKRTLPTIDSSQKLDDAIKKNTDSLLELKKQAQNVGISWYNKAYRVFDSYIVQPGNNYNFLAPAFPYIGRNSELALSVAGLATLVAYRFGHLNHTPEDLIEETSRKIPNPNLGKNINITDREIPNPDYGLPPAENIDVTSAAIPNPDFGKNIHDRVIPNPHYGQHPAENIDVTSAMMYNPDFGKNIPDTMLPNPFYGKTHPPLILTDRENKIAVSKINFLASSKAIKTDSILRIFYKKYLHLIRDTLGLGYPIKKNQYGATDHDFYHMDHPIGHVGNLEELCFGTPTLYLWLFARTAAPSWSVWKDFCSWADTKTKKMANRLKGGAHLNKEIEPGGAIIPKVVLDDATGLTEAKVLLNKLIPFMLDPESAVRQGKVPDLGYIFTGDPGNGKTFIVECLAGSLNEESKKAGKNPNAIQLFPLDASWILSTNIGTIMALAKEKAPCILFIDEFDLLQLQRTANAPKLAEFLVEINACFKSDPTKPIVVITATNCPTHCDKALFRDGRLGTHIEFELPKKANRKEFLTKKLKNLVFDIDQFDVERLTLETDHLSYANMEKLIDLAAMDAKLERQLLQQRHIDHVYDYRLRHILFNNDAEQSQQELELIAAHIAGKTLATQLFSEIMEEGIARATILPYMAKRNEESPWMSFDQQRKEEAPAVIEHGKICTYNYYDRFNPTAHANRNAIQFHAMIQSLLAGFVAEELLLQVPSTYTYNVKDETRAGLLSLHIVAPGDSLEKMSDQQKSVAISKALQFKAQCKKDVLALLTEYRPALQALQKALLEKKILSGDEIKLIIAQAMESTVQEPVQVAAAA